MSQLEPSISTAMPMVSAMLTVLCDHPRGTYNRSPGYLARTHARVQRAEKPQGIGRRARARARVCVCGCVCVDGWVGAERGGRGRGRY